ncbi:MAG: hypothetical protein RRY36_09120 [Bacteroidaceae bacterium]
MSLSETLLRDAIAKKACIERTSTWDKNWDSKALVTYYKANPNWCLKNRFPSLAILEQYFLTEEVYKMGVFISKSIAMRITEPCYIFNNCKAGIVCSTISTVYFGLSSKAKIIVDSEGDLRIDYYDNTQIEIETKGTGKCTIYQYGPIAPIIIGKNIRIKDRRKEK